ncbi:MUC16 protein, partial [Rhadina sibilatrix]|nr:MUC16 protein [Rhadina sibilatrix]
AVTEHFSLNLTTTNLMFTTDLQTPDSRKFRSTGKIMKRYIDSLLQKSSIGPHFTGCNVTGFRSGRHGDDTKVDAVCSYKDNASLARFDRERLYQELSTMTNNVTQLGHYSLDRSSLYVNG